MKNPFEEAVFSDLLDNEYLRTIYSNLIYAYGKSVFQGSNERYENRPFELGDALHFANLLSMSTEPEKGDKHKSVAQEMVTMLRELYPCNKEVELVAARVLDNVGNYRGLEIIKADDAKETGILDKIASEYEKELVVIPAEPDKHFFKAQKKVYSKILTENFSFSGPTSMGKSFIMRMFIKEQVQKGAALNFAVIIPTKALINEVSGNIIQDLKELLEQKDYRVVTTAGDMALTQEHNFILVMTPERLSYLLCNKSDFKLDFIFIDEAHKISSNEKRSAVYYKITDMLADRVNPPRFIFASPNIPNPQVYLDLLNSHATESAFASLYTPVSQEKFMIDLVGGDISYYNNITESFEKLRDGAKNVKMSDIIAFLGEGKQNLVYCHSKANAVEYAMEYYKQCEDLHEQKLDSLAISIKKDIHDDYFLAELLKRGIAYHVGYLPANIRMKLEKYYREGLIKTMFCTSTLIEGVNLPADNLFITSNQNGKASLRPVEFCNLMGRVGRIQYSLYGNVFILCTQDSPKEKFEEIVKTKTPEQKLSVVTALTSNQKKKIVESLKRGEIELPKYPEKQTTENYDLVRKFSLILLKDIFSGKQSRVRKEFSGFISDLDEQIIKDAFEEKGQIPEDDISTSCDQIVNLRAAIEDGLSYPELTETDIDFEQLVTFLNKLAVIFKWDVYEKLTLGYKNKESKEFTHLRFYATILRQWIQGYGLSNIINKAIEYKERNPESGVWIGHYRKATMYNNTIEHKNYVISETLSIIDNVILFSISNYFLRFSTEYKLIHGVDSLLNDWYEFVEYGTRNRLTILLQRSGYSREAASYIRTHQNEYVVYKEQMPLLRRTLLDCSNEGVSSETEDVIYNMPELFEPEEICE